MNLRTHAAAVLCALLVLADAVHAREDEGWEGFLARWRAAVAANDAAALAGMAQLPFLFEGGQFDREGMAATVVPALMTPEVRRCLRDAAPLREGDGYMLSCAPYLFYLARVDGRWRWVEFAADGEE